MNSLPFFPRLTKTRMYYGLISFPLFHSFSERVLEACPVLNAQICNTYHYKFELRKLQEKA